MFSTFKANQTGYTDSTWLLMFYLRISDLESLSPTPTFPIFRLASGVSNAFKSPEFTILYPDVRSLFRVNFSFGKIFFERVVALTARPHYMKKVKMKRRGAKKRRVSQVAGSISSVKNSFGSQIHSLSHTTRKRAMVRSPCFICSVDFYIKRCYRFGTVTPVACYSA